MKKCSNCTKEIPDTAMHCVFCGSKQAGAAPPAGIPGAPMGPPVGGGGPQKTIMGYAAAIPNLPTPPAAARPPSAPPAGMGPPPGGLPPMSPPAPMAPPPMAPPPMAPPMAAPMAPPVGPPPGGLPPMAPPMAGLPPMAPPMAAPMGPPPGGLPPMAPPMAGPPPMMSPPMAPPMMAPPPMGTPVAVSQPARPPYLASETGARAAAPAEPWAGTLRTLMIVMGVLLVGTFAAPWFMGEETQFSWDWISEAGDAEKTLQQLWPIALAFGGVLGLALGAIPVSNVVRGIGATVAGLAVVVLAGLAFTEVVDVEDLYEWRVFAIMASMTLGPAALILRAKYAGSFTARVVGTVAAAGALAAFLVPSDGDMPLTVLKDALEDAETSTKLVIYAHYLVFAAGVSALVTWLPASATPMTTLFAWISAAAVPVLCLSAFVFGPMADEAELGDLIEASGIRVYPAIQFLAGSLLAGYGIATLLGKAEESPSA